MIRYGLANDKGLLGFETTSNDMADFCVSVSYELEPPEYAHNVWLVDTYEKAAIVAGRSTPWFNARYETPENNFVGNCRVVKLKIEVVE